MLEFEAAAELKLMQFEPAITNTQGVVAIASQQPMQVTIDPRNLSKLLEAAKVHDTNFVYHPGGVDYSEWPLFVKPEP